MKDFYPIVGSGMKIILKYGNKSFEFFADMWRIFGEGINVNPVLEIKNYSPIQMKWLKEKLEKIKIKKIQEHQKIKLILIRDFGNDKNKKNWLFFHNVEYWIMNESEIHFILKEK